MSSHSLVADAAHGDIGDGQCRSEDHGQELLARRDKEPADRTRLAWRLRLGERCAAWPDRAGRGRRPISVPLSGWAEVSHDVLEVAWFRPDRTGLSGAPRCRVL